MDRDEDGAEAPGGITAALLAGEDAARAPAPDDLVLRPEADVDGRVLDSERAERLQRIGAEVQPRSDLAELGDLLVYLRFDAAAVHREARGEAAEPAADDRDLGGPEHVRTRRATAAASDCVRGSRVRKPECR